MTQQIFIDSDVEDKTTLTNVVAAVNVFLGRLKPTVKAFMGTPLHNDPSTLLVHITQDKRHTGASGYHILLNGEPVAYCLANEAGLVYGHYSPKTSTHGELFTPSVVATVCHEIAEMLADGNVATYTSPDSHGNQWLLEPCDWVFGEYWTATVNGHLCVFPNVALDSYHDLKGKAPYDLMGLVKAPFERTPKGYAYYLDPATKKLMPVTY